MLVSVCCIEAALVRGHAQCCVSMHVSLYVCVLIRAPRVRVRVGGWKGTYVCVCVCIRCQCVCVSLCVCMWARARQRMSAQRRCTDGARVCARASVYGYPRARTAGVLREESVNSLSSGL